MKFRIAVGGFAVLAVAGTGILVAGLLHSSSPAAAPVPAGAESSPAVAASSQPAVRSSGADILNTESSQPPASTAPTTSAPRVTQQPVPQTGLSASSIRIPALGVTAAIGKATITNGVLIPPKVPNEVGAWEGSAALDAGSGDVTLAGHVNWAGLPPFAFGHLASLHTGDLVYTTDAHGAQTSWRITAVTARPKTASVDPTAFSGARGPRKLVLITCGGSFDSGDQSYNDNIYVMASPATSA